jgi:hypothetical protein
LHNFDPLYSYSGFFISFASLKKAVHIFIIISCAIGLITILGVHLYFYILYNRVGGSPVAALEYAENMSFEADSLRYAFALVFYIFVKAGWLFYAGVLLGVSMALLGLWLILRKHPWGFLSFFLAILFLFLMPLLFLSSGYIELSPIIQATEPLLYVKMLVPPTTLAAAYTIYFFVTRFKNRRTGA